MRYAARKIGLFALTLWAYDLSYMLYGAISMLGAHYTLLKGAHIRTDMLWDKFSVRTKGRIDAVAYFFFFFPAMIMPTKAATAKARRSRQAKGSAP